MPFRAWFLSSFCVLAGACAPHAAAVPAPAPPAAPAVALATPPAPPPPAIGFRLPAGSRPLAYRMTLALDPAADDLRGEGEIDLERDRAGQPLYLHAHELTIASALLRDASGAEIPLVATQVDDQMIALQPASAEAAIPAGKSTLRLTWSARIRHGSSEGAFAQQYDGAWYAYTQFEALDARWVFPCFDEPAFKVPWQLTLEVPRGQVALSNTPVAEQHDQGERTRVVFAATPPLPSYLIAFAVGPFDLVDAGKSSGGAPIRVAVPRGHAAEAAIPVADTAPLLAILEDYFGTPYPFAKLDVVPIPDTVAFSAMENPGLITYRASILLTRPEEVTPWDRRTYAYVGAHEMAHQWFGDLVTMAWWDDLWLNEAFASWMGNRVVHTWKPEWDTDIKNVDRKQYAMSADSRANARRIREPVVSENDVEDAFDGITYSKGAAVIGMVERWIGAPAFQQGMRLYMKRHARGNATYLDLAAALAETSGQDVRVVFDDLVGATGVPYVSFTLVCEPGEKPRLDLSQRRFVPFASTVEAEHTWRLPITVRWQAGQSSGRSQTVLTGAKGQLVLGEAPACPDWVMPNDAASGYYRWSLAGAPGERLRSRKVLRTLSGPERLEVATSVSALVTAGELPYRSDVEMAMTLIDDPERQVREVALGAGAGWADLLPAAMRPRYRAWVRRTYGGAARTAGFVPRPGESDDDKAVRARLLERMVTDGEDAATRREATRLAWKWLDDRTALAPEMIDPVLQLAAHAGDARLYDRLLAEARLALAAKDKPARQRFLGALADFSDLELARRSHELVLSDEFSILETLGLLWTGTSTRAGRARAVAFVREHYDALRERTPREYRARLIYIAGDCTAEGLASARAFFGERTPTELSGPRTYATFVEQQAVCIARRERDRASFIEFLRRPR